MCVAALSPTANSLSASADVDVAANRGEANGMPESSTSVANGINMPGTASSSSGSCPAMEATAASASRETPVQRKWACMPGMNVVASADKGDADQEEPP
eukprot:CAMPEP_0172780622 /NCGR_PEP_ID=MMETSP1074-20121228/203021_1 /TAXON_ID=2916 /ORGANISM="Ceratium fusus, Strain PA161109" /LENGTH=98 /DNA_ID=CAMNT_0013617599 /DNA_START=133 /DNA_END=429 /DNA_ORIENTATION=-